MSVAFCFPGQGSLETGMGRDFAEAMPEVMAVYERGSDACGLDLKKLCFDTPIEEVTETELQQPALVATSLAILAALREEGIEADYVVGHSVGEFAALAAASSIGVEETIGLVRERGMAMAEAAQEYPGRMAAILGLDDDVVERICRRIRGVWPANYNCPGQIVVSGENEAVEECCAEAESLGARRAIRLKVSGAFHSPLVGKAADRLKPAIDRVKFAEPVAPFMSTVTAKIEPAQRLASLLVDQLVPRMLPAGDPRRSLWVREPTVAEREASVKDRASRLPDFSVEQLFPANVDQVDPEGGHALRPDNPPLIPVNFGNGL